MIGENSVGVFRTYMEEEASYNLPSHYTSVKVQILILYLDTYLDIH